MKKEYEDILYFDYKGPYKHPKMPLEKRAAQFMPFAALTGYAEAIEEKGRTVLTKRELTEEEKEEISKDLIYLLEHKKEQISAEFTFFVKDELKEGGTYRNYKGILLDYDQENGILRISPSLKIHISDLMNIKIMESRE